MPPDVVVEAARDFHRALRCLDDDALAPRCLISRNESRLSLTIRLSGPHKVGRLTDTHPAPPLELCRFKMSVVHFSVQGNHLHLIVESSDEVRLARGLQGLAVRIARRLNRMMGRKGKVFADRYHSHVLRTPAEVARAVAYVIGNYFVHALRRGERVDPVIDEYSSAVVAETGPPLVAVPQTWLLCTGWRRAR